MVYDPLRASGMEKEGFKATEKTIHAAVLTCMFCDGV